MAIKGSCLYRGILVCTGMVGAQAHGSVNLELRPPTQTVRVGNTASIGLYAVSDTGGSEPVGRVRAVLTWDPAILMLSGHVDNGPYPWLFSGFLDDSEGDGLNNTFLDGNAFYESLAQFGPPAMATPAGLLVTTFEFVGQETQTNSIVAVVPQLLMTFTEVLNALPPGGIDVTGSVGSNVVTVICLNSADCNDVNPCTDDGCVGQACQHVPNDTVDPNDGFYCNGIEDSCQGGIIIYESPPPDCDDGFPCTSDSCDEANDICAHSIMTNRCLIEGACYSLGALNPANECQVCSPAQSTTSWTFRSAGAACGDPGDSECDNPNSCNGAGLCLDNYVSDGTACATDDNSCTLDECMSGTCTHSPLPLGSLCGDSSSSACTNPDSCDGAGTCLGNHAPEGTACNDGLFCTISSSCQMGTCVGSGNACVGLICDEASDRCKAINLAWSPLSQAVLVNGTVDVDLYAVSGIGENLAFNAAGVIVGWDPTRLELLGHLDTGPYLWVLSGFPNDCGLDGLNQPCTGIPENDGNAYYEAVGQFAPGQPAIATPSGLKVTTLRFRTLVADPIPTAIEFVPTFGVFTQTQVLDAEVPALNILTSLGADAQVTILQCTAGAQCADEEFCNGIEQCISGQCGPGPYPCGAQFCDESADACVDCLIDVHCDDGQFCNGAETCQANLCLAGTNPCPDSFCVEDSDQCVECLTSADCDDQEICTEDICGSGVCVYNTTDKLCNDGLFCNGLERCIPGMGCVSPGNPCPDPITCEEGSGTCGGCEVPSVIAEGSRYLRVIPPPGPQPVALFVLGVSGGAVNCVALYIQADGTLAQDPVFKTPAEWGTIHLHSSVVLPATKYRVHTDCGTILDPLLSAGVSQSCWNYGDINHDGFIDLDDLLLIFDAFIGNFELTTLEATDIGGCEPNQTVDLDDILTMIDAFNGSESDCAEPCPAATPPGYLILVLLVVAGAYRVFRQ